MQLRVLKLGTKCQDIPTGLSGAVTHWIMDQSKKVEYLFQPRGLDDDHQPLERIFTEIERLKVTDKDFEIVEVPFEILGSIVEDEASGFKGVATKFVRHINGCFHVCIQPSGLVPKTKKPIKWGEFDLRGCTGKMIKKLSADELQKSQKENPSPGAAAGQQAFPRADRILS